MSKAIHASLSISMLAGNPLLLTMMAILNRYQELPRDRVMLYQKSAEVLLQQWDTERGLVDFPEISKEIDLRAKTAILRKVAYRMQNGRAEGEAANIIKGHVLTELIEEYLQEELNVQQSRAAANALVRQLRERNFILCYLGADTYAFVHRTFLEYFCAAEIVRQFQEEQSLLLPGLKQIYHKHYRDDDWAEVLRLVCGQIDEQFVGEIVKQLMSETDLNSWDGELYLPEIPLAVWCFGEARKISKLTDTGEMLFTHVTSFFNTEKNELEPSIYIALLAATKVLNGNWPGAKKVNPREELKSAANFSQIFWPNFNYDVFQDKQQVIEFSSAPQELVRSGAIEYLAINWQNESTFTMLAKCAKDDKAPSTRGTALGALAKHWPDESTRTFLIERAKDDKDVHPRGIAMQAMAKHWPDESTRTFLIERAKDDKGTHPRSKAVQALAQHWPDESTRTFLIGRVKYDEDTSLREAALIALKKYWLDDLVAYNFIKERAYLDGAAAKIIGENHSEFGAIVFTKDLDGVAPYINPREGLTSAHIKEAAKTADVTNIPAELKSLSEHLGWDVTQGSA